MIETMHAAPGVGLAAPQVGVSMRVVVIETPDEGLLTLINPEMVKTSGERRVMEGCLSVPGYQAEITRSQHVTAKALDREGKEVRIKAPIDRCSRRRCSTRSTTSTGSSTSTTSPARTS